jgi:hypothetical protein
MDAIAMQDRESAIECFDTCLETGAFLFSNFHLASALKPHVDDLIEQIGTKNSQ